MLDLPIRRLLATARRYRAAFYTLQAAVDAGHERAGASTSQRLQAARAEMEAARRALLAAALWSDDAEVLLPRPPAEPGVGPVR